MNYRAPLHERTPSNTFNTYYDNNQFSKYGPPPAVNFSHPVAYNQPAWGNMPVSPRSRPHIPTFAPYGSDNYSIAVREPPREPEPAYCITVSPPPPPKEPELPKRVSLVFRQEEEEEVWH